MNELTCNKKLTFHVRTNNAANKYGTICAPQVTFEAVEMPRNVKRAKQVLLLSSWSVMTRVHW